MTIQIVNNQTKQSGDFTYLATMLASLEAEFYIDASPVTLNPNNAEGMLHMLDALCYHPEVDLFIRDRIPSPFYPYVRFPWRDLPMEPLLNYIAGPKAIQSVCWDSPVTYTKTRDGLTVGYYNYDFVFPSPTSFADLFRRSYGIGQWNNRSCGEEITSFSFVNEASNDVAAILRPYETFFIKQQDYFKLCRNLQRLCMSVEKLFDCRLFYWDQQVKPKAFLLELIQENSLLHS